MNKKNFLKKILSYIPFLNKIIRKIYSRYKYSSCFIPINEQFSYEEVLKSKIYRLDLENFNKLKENYDYFFISKNNWIKRYPKEKFNKLVSIIKKERAK